MSDIPQRGGRSRAALHLRQPGPSQSSIPRHGQIGAGPSPEYGLNDDEYATLPLQSKKLRSAIKKYYGVMKEMPLSLAKELLMKTAAEMPALESGAKNEAVYVSDLTGPWQFFLRWEAQEDRFNLITFILNETELKKLDMRQYPGVKLENKMVAARRNNIWARGFVKTVTVLPLKTAQRKQVVVFFMDYGDEATVDPESLRMIPEEFCGFGSLCFRAALKLKSFQDKASVQMAKHRFNELVRGCSDQKFLCQIETSVTGPSKIATYQVLLWKQNGAGKEFGKDIHDTVVGREKLTAAAAAPPLPQQAQNLGLTIANIPRPSHTIAHSEDDILPYVDNEPKKMKPYRIVNAVSPGELYLQPCISITNGAPPPPWVQKLQDVYKNRQTRLSHRIRGGSLTKNRCYVWNDRETNFWHRVRVVDYISKSAPFLEANLWCMDMGKMVQGHVSDTYELLGDYNYSALAFRVHLVHVSLGKRSPKDYTNNDLVMERFREKCSTGLVFSGVVLSEEIISDDIPPGSRDPKSYGMILAEYSERENKGTLQAELVKENLVLANGPAAGRHDLSYYVLGKEPIYSREDMKREFKLTLPDGRLEKLRLMSHPADSLVFGNLVARPDPEKEASSKKYLVEGMQCKLGFVKISSVTRPDSFCIQMMHKVQQLSQMEKDFETLVGYLSIVPAETISPGMICLAQSTIEDRTKVPLWGRVAILSIKPGSDVAMALYIDHGFEQPVVLSTVRELPPYFSNIPSFCHRAHLDFSTKENMLVPSNVEWNDQNCWGSYIEVWNWNISTKYYAWQTRLCHDPDGVIELEEYNQVLDFDATPMSWYAGRLRKQKEYVHLNQHRRHPLLKQFYKSIGVELHFELENSGADIQTHPAWALLQDIGHVKTLEVC